MDAKMYMSLIFSGISIVGVLILTYFGSKWIAKRYSGAANGKHIHIIDRAVIGKEKSIVVADIYGSKYILATTGQNVTLLKDLGEFQPKEEVVTQPSDFMTLFSGMLKRPEAQNKQKPVAAEVKEQAQANSEDKPKPVLSRNYYFMLIGAMLHKWILRLKDNLSQQKAKSLAEKSTEVIPKPIKLHKDSLSEQKTKNLAKKDSKATSKQSVPRKNYLDIIGAVLQKWMFGLKASLSNQKAKALTKKDFKTEPKQAKPHKNYLAMISAALQKWILGLKASLSNQKAKALTKKDIKAEPKQANPHKNYLAIISAALQKWILGLKASLFKLKAKALAKKSAEGSEKQTKPHINYLHILGATLQKWVSAIKSSLSKKRIKAKTIDIMMFAKKAPQPKHFIKLDNTVFKKWIAGVKGIIHQIRAQNGTPYSSEKKKILAAEGSHLISMFGRSMKVQASGVSQNLVTGGGKDETEII